MKRRLGIGLVVFLLAAVVYPAASQERFDRACRYFEEARYQDAFLLFHQVAKDIPHWKIFYNLGNCCYQLKYFVQAKYWFLKAQKYSPQEESIANNIEIVNRYFKDLIHPESPDLFSRLLTRMENLVTLNLVFIMIVGLVGLFNFFLFQLLKKGKSKKLIYGLVFSLIPILLFSFYHFSRVQVMTSQRVALVLKDNLELRSSPGSDSTVLFKVNAGLELRIVDQSRNWFQVAASSQVAGWVEADHLALI